MKNRNCPNCGSPLTIDSIKCPYCGTLYFDMTSLDLSENTPVFIRYKVPYDKERNAMSYCGNDYAYITQLAIPHLDDVTMESNSTDVIDRHGLVHRIYNGRTCITNLTFQAVPFGNRKELFRLEIPE